MIYTPARSQMSHQTRAIAAASEAPAHPSPSDAFAYLMDYGTGKSQVVLDEWGSIATGGGPMDLLVVAPKGSIRNWHEDKSDLQRAEISNMDPEFVSRMRVLGWSNSKGMTFREKIKRFLRVGDFQDRPRALFMNVEALSKPGPARDLLREYVAQRHCYGAIDESTTIKGRKSKRTKFLWELGESMAVRRIATGLLTPKGPTDAFAQFWFLDYRILGCRSWQSFEGRYCVTRRMEVNNRRFDVIVGYRNLEDLQERIAPYSYRVLKSECLDLEPKKYVMWEVEHTAEQARLYAELRESAMAQLSTGEHVVTEHVMTLVMRLHQINCGFATDEHGAEHEVESNRVDDLLEILGQHRGKAVIWCPYRRPLAEIVRRIAEEYGEKSVAQFHGGNARERTEEERRFLGDPDCRFMIATQGAAGRGNTWVNADLEIYYANNDDLEQRYNSEDRLHRKGQINRVTVLDMVVPGTVDINIVRRLRKKITMATTLTGEEARAWLI